MPTTSEGKRRRLIPLIVAVACLALVDVSVRAAVPRAASFNAWNDWQATHKVAAIDALARRGGSPLVLMGSSMMDYAVDPGALSKLLGLKRPVFNASLNGAEARLMDFWLLNVVVPRLRPRVVVIGVSSRELNDLGEGTRRAFDAVRDSYGGRAVAGDLSPTERILELGERVSGLVRYRSLLRKPSRLFDAEPLEEGLAVSALGAPTHSRRTDVYRTLPPISGGFAVGGSSMRALDHLIGRLESLGIRVLLVEMPISPDGYARHPNGIADYRSFQQAVAGFVAAKGLPFSDMLSPFPTTEWFGDTLHLNRRGRERFTRLLAGILAPSVADL
ncbi:MAG: hypothetical protein WEB06_04735 [Actinomycetota bacterium]